MGALPLSVCAPYACLVSTEAVLSPGTGIIDGCKPPCGC